MNEELHIVSITVPQCKTVGPFLKPLHVRVYLWLRKLFTGREYNRYIVFGGRCSEDELMDLCSPVAKEESERIINGYVSLLSNRADN